MGGAVYFTSKMASQTERERSKERKKKKASKIGLMKITCILQYQSLRGEEKQSLRKPSWHKPTFASPCIINLITVRVVVVVKTQFFSQATYGLYQIIPCVVLITRDLITLARDLITVNFSKKKWFQKMGRTLHYGAWWKRFSRSINWTKYNRKQCVYSKQRVSISILNYPLSLLEWTQKPKYWVESLLKSESKRYIHLVGHLCLRVDDDQHIIRYYAWGWGLKGPSCAVIFT